jgi:hypothetical protein
MKSFLKIVAFNTLLTGFLLAALVIGAPLAWDVRDFLKPEIRDGRINAAAYKGATWPAKHFGEFYALQTFYYDYFIWRRGKFSGETIHVDGDGYRRHDQTERADAKVWLFGGSTMWGTGSQDDGTIPAHLAKLAGKSTFNFGESGYTAHQSLNLLMKLLTEGGKPEYIVFYDGVNEVEHKCRTQTSFYATFYENQIRETMRANEASGSHVLRVFRPLQEFVAKLFGPGSASNVPWFNCQLDDKKADLIARNLANDWVTAKFLAEARGVHFIGVLQPVAYVGSPNISSLPDVTGDTLLRTQYSILYPKFKAELARAGIDFLDLTEIFDGSTMTYIDFCHVIADGDAKIAAAMARVVR